MNNNVSNKAAAVLERLKKISTIKKTELLAESDILKDPVTASTRVPILNLAWQGTFDGGIGPGITTIAGPSRHFKTSFGLVGVAAYLDKYDDAVCLFYNNEFGAKKSYFTEYGVDINRVLHTPFEDIEKLKSDIAIQLENLEPGTRIIIFIDSIGNAASIKEVEDALSQHSAADMTRAKQLKSLFRIITPKLYLKEVPMICINHSYKTQELYSKDVVGGGCVVAGTKIIMADGTTRNIEDVIVGEYVKTKDGDKEVTNTWNPTTLLEGTPECLELTFEDGTTITCSKKHKFFMNGKWIEAQNLVGGEDLDII